MAASDETLELTACTGTLSCTAGTELDWWLPGWNLPMYSPAAAEDDQAMSASPATIAGRTRRRSWFMESPWWSPSFGRPAVVPAAWHVPAASRAGDSGPAGAVPELRDSGEGAVS